MRARLDLDRRHVRLKIQLVCRSEFAPTGRASCAWMRRFTYQLTCLLARVMLNQRMIAEYAIVRDHPQSRPCESRDLYAVHYREDTAYGSRLHKRVYARLRRAMGRDDPESEAPILLLSMTLQRMLRSDRHSAVGWAKAAAGLRLMHRVGSAVPTRVAQSAERLSVGTARLCPLYTLNQRSQPPGSCRRVAAFAALKLKCDGRISAQAIGLSLPASRRKPRGAVPATTGIVG
jgi:hypothetical protein